MRSAETIPRRQPASQPARESATTFVTSVETGRTRRDEAAAVNSLSHSSARGEMDGYGYVKERSRSYLRRARVCSECG